MVIDSSDFRMSLKNQKLEDGTEKDSPEDEKEEDIANLKRVKSDYQNKLEEDSIKQKEILSQKLIRTRKIRQCNEEELIKLFEMNQAGFTKLKEIKKLKEDGEVAYREIFGLSQPGKSASGPEFDVLLGERELMNLKDK